MQLVFGRGATAPLLSRLLVASVVCAVPLSAGASPPSCKSITKGNLDVQLPAGQRSSRMVRLAEGDTVNFLIDNGASGATVTLVSGAGAPQTLLAPNAGGMATFCAPATATYVFAIEAGRDNHTAVSANCTRAGDVATFDATARPELSLAQLETDEEGLTRRSAFSLSLSEIAASAKVAASPFTHWSEDAEATPTSVDTSDGDADTISAAALSFSANSEIGPDDLPIVLTRIERTAAQGEAPVDVEAQTAMTWSAILTPGLSFAPPRETRVVAKRTTRKDAQIASETPAAQDWWVTHLHDNRQSTETAATETAVARTDTVAYNPFPIPPMALGAFIPAAEGLAAAQPSTTAAQ